MTQAFLENFSISVIPRFVWKVSLTTWSRYNWNVERSEIPVLLISYVNVFVAVYSLMGDELKYLLWLIKGTSWTL